MQTVSASEAKEKFGEIMASRDTIVITRYGRPDKVLIDYDRLQELQAAEDRYWLEESRKGEESGSLGVEASEAYLRSILNAKD